MPLLTQQANDQSLPLARPAQPAPSAGVRTEIAASLPYYIARVQAIPPLSREDEYDLACRIRDVVGDEDAARKLVEANLRYVVAIALSYRRYGVRLADLISEGNVGLMIALKKFDPSRGTRFVTYAAHWIRAYVLDHVIRAWSIVGVGAGPLRSKVFFRLRREKAKILASTSDAVEANERLAERFGTTSEKISMMANRLEARDVSLDAKVFDDGAATVLDTVPGNGPSQEEQYLSRERSTSVHACVREAVEKLDPRERFIVEVRMMADHADELSLAEIGRRLGVSRERARQLEARAKQKLRRHLETHGGEFSTAA
jgi:RNA polymerase sigma-32 factor